MFPEHLEHQIGSAVDHLGLIGEIGGRGDEAAQLDHLRNPVEQTGGLELRQDHQPAGARRLLAALQAHLRAQLAGHQLASDEGQLPRNEAPAALHHQRLIAGDGCGGFGQGEAESFEPCGDGHAGVPSIRSSSQGKALAQSSKLRLAPFGHPRHDKRRRFGRGQYYVVVDLVRGRRPVVQAVVVILLRLREGGTAASRRRRRRRRHGRRLRADGSVRRRALRAPPHAAGLPLLRTVGLASARQTAGVADLRLRRVVFF